MTDLVNYMKQFRAEILKLLGTSTGTIEPKHPFSLVIAQHPTKNSLFATTRLLFRLRRVLGEDPHDTIKTHIEKLVGAEFQHISHNTFQFPFHKETYWLEYPVASLLENFKKERQSWRKCVSSLLHELEAANRETPIQEDIPWDQKYQDLRKIQLTDAQIIRFWSVTATELYLKNVSFLFV